MSTTALPPHLLAQAVQSGSEFGWRSSDFPAVLRSAAAEGFACLGGQFQWVLSDGTCEPYWLNADARPKLPAESWAAYVRRAEAEVEEGFALLLRTTDFDTEAEKWPHLREKKEQGVPVNDYLVFVAYFTEANHDA